MLKYHTENLTIVVVLDQCLNKHPKVLDIPTTLLMSDVWQKLDPEVCNVAGVFSKNSGKVATRALQ